MTHAAVRGILWLAFLLTMLGQGRYVAFVAEWQVWLILASAFSVLIAVLAALRDGRACTHEGHGHETEGPTWHGTLVHGIPLFAALSLGDGGLGSHALGRTGFWQPAQTPVDELHVEFTPRFTASGGHSGDVSLTAEEAASQPQAMELHRLYQSRHLSDGSPVLVVGRFITGTDPALMTAERLPPGIAMEQVHGLLFRFVMSCCAADARPVGVVILGLPPPEGLDDKAWVRVQGRWRLPSAQGFAAIDVEQWERVPPPRVEFLLAD